jgi:hypothetical protein
MITFLCINNFSVPVKVEKTPPAKKLVKSTYPIAPSILIVAY